MRRKVKTRAMSMLTTSIVRNYRAKAPRHVYMCSRKHRVRDRTKRGLPLDPATGRRHIPYSDGIHREQGSRTGLSFAIASAATRLRQGSRSSTFMTAMWYLSGPNGTCTRGARPAVLESSRSHLLLRHEKAFIRLQTPHLEPYKRSTISHIVYQERSLGLAIVRLHHGRIALLSRRVPYLQSANTEHCRSKQRQGSREPDTHAWGRPPHWICAPLSIDSQGKVYLRVTSSTRNPVPGLVSNTISQTLEVGVLPPLFLRGRS